MVTGRWPAAPSWRHHRFRIAQRTGRSRRARLGENPGRTGWGEPMRALRRREFMRCTVRWLVGGIRPTQRGTILSSTIRWEWLTPKFSPTLGHVDKIIDA